MGLESINYGDEGREWGTCAVGIWSYSDWGSLGYGDKAYGQYCDVTMMYYQDQYRGMDTTSFGIRSAGLNNFDAWLVRITIRIMNELLSHTNA